jgi:hypothetical protein
MAFMSQAVSSLVSWFGSVGWLTVVIACPYGLGGFFVHVAYGLRFQLADAFPCEIHDLGHLFEGDAAFVGHIEGTGFRKLINGEGGEVEPDGVF